MNYIELETRAYLAGDTATGGDRMKAATKEFFIGSQKFTPRAATVNGLKGRIWVKRILQDGGWVHAGSAHLRSSAHEVEVTAAFDLNEVDRDAVMAYWEKGTK